MAMYNPTVLGGNNHQDIQDAYRLLASQHSTPDQSDPVHNPIVTNRLMTQQQNTQVPRAPPARLGAPFLGLDIDEVDEHSEQDLCATSLCQQQTPLGPTGSQGANS